MGYSLRATEPGISRVLSSLKLSHGWMAILVLIAMHTLELRIQTRCSWKTEAHICPRLGCNILSLHIDDLMNFKDQLVTKEG